MQIEDMLDATNLRVEFQGKAWVGTVLVGPGLPIGKWRVHLLDARNASVSISAMRIVGKGTPEVTFDLDPPVSWATARACHLGFQRVR